MLLVIYLGLVSVLVSGVDHFNGGTVGGDVPVGTLGNL